MVNVFYKVESVNPSYHIVTTIKENLKCFVLTVTAAASVKALETVEHPTRLMNLTMTQHLVNIHRY